MTRVAAGDDERRPLVPEHPGERASVELDDVHEHALGGLVEAALLRRLPVLQELRAHHRRERERHDGREEDRHRQRHRELPEEPPDHVGHEEKGDQHRDERDREGEDREADLLGALQRGLERVLSLTRLVWGVASAAGLVVSFRSWSMPCGELMISTSSFTR